MTKEELGRRIAAARESKGWHQSDLAEALGVEPPSVSRWETGKSKPSSDRIPKIAEILGVPVSYLSGVELKEPKASEVNLPDLLARLSQLENRLQDSEKSKTIDDLKDEIEKLKAERDDYKAKWEDVGTQAAIRFAKAILKVPADRLSFVVSEFRKDRAG